MLYKFGPFTDDLLTDILIFYDGIVYNVNIAWSKILDLIKRS